MRTREDRRGHKGTGDDKKVQMNRREQEEDRRGQVEGRREQEITGDDMRGQESMGDDR